MKLYLNDTERFSSLFLTNSPRTSSRAPLHAASSSAPVPLLTTYRPTSLPTPTFPKVFLDINEEYTRSTLTSIFSTAPRSSLYTVVHGTGSGDDAVTPPTDHFQFSEYERADWEAVLAGEPRIPCFGKQATRTERERTRRLGPWRGSTETAVS